MRCALLTLVMLISGTVATHGQVLAGRLLEVESRAPLAGGTVLLLGADSATVAQVATDSLGFFRLAAPAGGGYRVSAIHTGYLGATSETFGLGPRDTLEVEFRLARGIVVLEPLVVTGRSRRLGPAARDFYQRAAANPFGSYVTRADIERARPARTTDLFRRIPGVRITPVQGGNVVTVRGTCRPTVYVDGVRIEGYRSIDHLAQPMEIEGVEVYRSLDAAPPQYTGLRGGCAVILIWTRID